MDKFLNFKTKRFFIGIFFAIVSLLFTVYFTGELKAGFLFSVLFIIAGGFTVKKDAFSNGINEKVYFAWMLVSSFIVCYLSQLVLCESFILLGLTRMFLGMSICMVLFLALYIITLRPLLSVSIITLFLVLSTVVNYFVYEFRGSEINPVDILSIQTAGNVAAEYRIELTNPQCYAIVLTAIYLFLSFGLSGLKVVGKIRTRIFSGMFITVLIILFIPISLQIETRGYKMSGSNTNGFFLNFVLQIRETFVKKPKGYSIEAINEIGKEKMNNSEIAEATEDNPDIIVIMNESFADLSILGSELNVNQEVTPFINSLSENTIRGNALSSVYGGGTPNSEYEFLSGNSLLFLPTGAIVYQQYLKSPTYSMVEELKTNGYKCISMHPFLSNGWTRPIVYPYLGFDESYFVEDFSDEYMMRDYVSDYGMFVKLIELYEENKAADKDVFMFGVTMQNHGGYKYSGDNYEQTIYLDGYAKDYDNAEQYLSLIHASDSAMEYLIHYFENVNDNVVILFYGDHLPKLNDSFYEEIHGGKFETLDERQLEYIVPFFIWTNYDIEEESVELTSFNYLSNYVYKAARLQLPEYNKFLEDVQNVIPAMNANGYFSKTNNCFMKYQDAAGEEAEILNLYNQLEYNDLFDKDNRNNILFPVSFHN